MLWPHVPLSSILDPYPLGSPPSSHSSLFVHLIYHVCSNPRTSACAMPSGWNTSCPTPPPAFGMVGAIWSFRFSQPKHHLLLLASTELLLPLHHFCATTSFCFLQSIPYHLILPSLLDDLLIHFTSCHWNRTSKRTFCCCCSVAKSCPTLWLHGLQHPRLLCPPLSSRVSSNSCPLSWWCHPTILSSASLFSWPQSFPASGSFPESALPIRWPKYWSFHFTILAWRTPWTVWRHYIAPVPRISPKI